MHLRSRDALAFDQPRARPLGYCDNGGGVRVKGALQPSQQPKGEAAAVVGPDASLRVVPQRSEGAYPVPKCDPEATKVERPGGGGAGLGVEVVREIANVEAGHAGQGCCTKSTSRPLRERRPEYREEPFGTTLADSEESTRASPNPRRFPQRRFAARLRRPGSPSVGWRQATADPPSGVGVAPSARHARDCRSPPWRDRPPGGAGSA